MIELEDILTVAMKAKAACPEDLMTPILTVELASGEEVFAMVEGDKAEWVVAMVELTLEVGPIVAVALVAEASVSTYARGQIPENVPSPLDDLSAESCLLVYRVSAAEQSCESGLIKYGRGDRGELVWKGADRGNARTVEGIDDMVVGMLRAMCGMR